MDALVELRATLKQIAEKHKIKLSYLPFMMKAASLALRHYPQLNATVNADVTEVTHHASHNIGLAMDTPAGLVVPVVRDVQNKSIFEIAADLHALQASSFYHVSRVISYIDSCGDKIADGEALIWWNFYTI